MAGIKKTWRAVIGALPVTHFQHRYEHGKPAGASFRVRLMMTVHDGPEAGREIEVWMTSKEARTYALTLTQAADNAERKNEMAGHIDGA